jgi:hypothetical protein
MRPPRVTITAAPGPFAGNEAASRASALAWKSACERLAACAKAGPEDIMIGIAQAAAHAIIARFLIPGIRRTPNVSRIASSGGASRLDAAAKEKGCTGRSVPAQHRPGRRTEGATIAPPRMCRFRQSPLSLPNLLLRPG